MVGTGAISLAALIKYPREAVASGQTGRVQFTCEVNEKGVIKWARVYKAIPDSTLFVKPVESALKRARFEPAMYDGTPVTVFVPATVLFQQEQNAPSVAIYLNNSEPDIAVKRNYIAMQSVVDRKQEVLWQITPGTLAPLSVEVSYCVEANGTVRDISVENESPPGCGLANYQREKLKRQKYIPAFRDNLPVRECVSTVLTLVPTDEVRRSRP